MPSTFFVRADPEAFGALIPAIRNELHAMSPAIRFVTVRPYRDYIDPQARSWSLGATMFTVFGALALAIAAVGLYGVLTFNIVQRTHELGVRTALVASPGRLIGMVLFQAVAADGAGRRHRSVGRCRRRKPHRTAVVQRVGPRSAGPRNRGVNAGARCGGGGCSARLARDAYRSEHRVSGRVEPACCQARVAFPLRVDAVMRRARMATAALRWAGLPGARPACPPRDAGHC